MKRHVVISYNFNPDYIYYAPLVMWGWKRLGWNPVLVWVDNPGIIELNKLVFDYSPEFTPIKVSEIEGYRSGTIAQVSRLYAATQLEGLIMTADADMLPLSDYWSPNPKERTVYGYDLTSFTEFPMCYAAMDEKKWKQLMQLDGTIDECIKRDLDARPKAKSNNFYDHWNSDQQILTERLKPYNPTLINRGQYSNGYAVGRVDRGSWTLSHSTFIDCHMFQQVYHKGREQYFEKTMELLRAMWPEEDFQWLRTYTNEFRKLTGHG